MTEDQRIDVWYKTKLNGGKGGGVNKVYQKLLSTIDNYPKHFIYFNCIYYLK